MRRIKAALVGLACLISALVSGACGVPPARSATDAPDDGPPVVMISGSGYICSAVVLERDVLVTAGHCLDAMTGPIDVRADGRYLSEAGRWRAPHSDIGLVYLPERLLVTPARIGDLPATFDDTWVRGFGCALHEKPAVIRLDTRPAVHVGLTSDGQLTFFGTVCHGDSGGAYFNDDGQLLGVNSLGFTSHDHPFGGTAAPIADALPGLLEKP